MSAKNITFKKRDKQRYVKIYPFVKEDPVEELVSTSTFFIETGIVHFDNNSQQTVKFATAFDSAPSVTLGVLDENVNTAGVNIVITSVTTKEFVVQSSQDFVGSVMYQVMQIP